MRRIPIGPRTSLSAKATIRRRATVTTATTAAIGAIAAGRISCGTTTNTIFPLTTRTTTCSTPYTTCGTQTPTSTTASSSATTINTASVSSCPAITTGTCRTAACTRTYTPPTPQIVTTVSTGIFNVTYPTCRGTTPAWVPRPIATCTSFCACYHRRTTDGSTVRCRVAKIRITTSVIYSTAATNGIRDRAARYQSSVI